MSTHQPVSFANPFDPAETLTGERVGKCFRPGSPYPLVRVRVDGCETPFVVEKDDIR